MALGFLLEWHRYTADLWQIDCSVAYPQWAGNGASAGSCISPLEGCLYPGGSIESRLRAHALE